MRSKFLIALAAMACLAVSSATQGPVRHIVPVMLAQAEPSLDVSGGDPKVVKVKRVIEVYDDRTVYTTFPITVKAPAGFGYTWNFPSTVTATRKGSQLEISAAPKGPTVVSVSWYVVNFKAETVKEEFLQRTIDIGDVLTPIPIPPVPDPKPSPISGEGKRVIITYESTQVPKLTKEQDRVIFGVPFRIWLESKVTRDKVRGGEEPSRRIADKDASTDNDLLWVQEMMARQKEHPWIAVSNSTTGAYEEGPLPKTETEIKAMITRVLP